MLSTKHTLAVISAGDIDDGEGQPTEKSDFGSRATASLLGKLLQ